MHFRPLAMRRVRLQVLPRVHWLVVNPLMVHRRRMVQVALLVVEVVAADLVPMVAVVLATTEAAALVLMEAAREMGVMS